MTFKLPRTVLFTPGTRPDRVAKAIGAGADSVCLDLEDAVPLAEKQDARKHVSEFLNVASNRRSVPSGNSNQQSTHARRAYGPAALARAGPAHTDIVGPES